VKNEPIPIASQSCDVIDYYDTSGDVGVVSVSGQH